MSAGTGIRHSEFNYSKTEECRLLQVWFLPEAENRKPGYEQKKFSQNDKRNNLKLVVSPTGKDGALSIGQDVEIYASILEKDKSLNHKTGGRKIWLQVVRGEVDVNGNKLIEGDGAHSGDEIELNIKALSDESEFIIFSIGK